MDSRDHSLLKEIVKGIKDPILLFVLAFTIISLGIGIYNIEKLRELKYLLILFFFGGIVGLLLYKILPPLLKIEKLDSQESVIDSNIEDLKRENVELKQKLESFTKFNEFKEESIENNWSDWEPIFDNILNNQQIKPGVWSLINKNNLLIRTQDNSNFFKDQFGQYKYKCPKDKFIIGIEFDYESNYNDKYCLINSMYKSLSSSDNCIQIWEEKHYGPRYNKLKFDINEGIALFFTLKWHGNGNSRTNWYFKITNIKIFLKNR